MGRRFFAVSFAFLCVSCGDRSDESTVSAKLDAGDSVQRIALYVERPLLAQDRFLVYAPNDVEVALIDPEGRRITPATTAQFGFTWNPNSHPDAPIVLAPVRDGKPGVFSVEFKGRNRTWGTTVRAKFVSQREHWDADRKRSWRGYLAAGPVTTNKGSGQVEFELRQDTPATILDILVSEPSAKVRLTLPGGVTLDETSRQEPGLTWTRRDRNAKRRNSYNQVFPLHDLLLLGAGVHHVIQMEMAPGGRYTVRVESPNSPATADIALVPFEGLPGGLARLEPGELEVRHDDLPHLIRAGDEVPVDVYVRGGVRHAGLKFKVRGAHGREESPLPVTVSRSPLGIHTLTLRPLRSEKFSVSIRVDGERTNGAPFSLDKQLGKMTVSPLNAEFEGIAERAVDTNGNGLFDHLEVAARLKVAIPGEYGMYFRITGADGGDSSEVRATKTLAAGRQILSATISAQRLLRDLPAAPWRISDLSIDRTGNWEGAVDIEKTEFTTAAYPRAKWDRGPAWGEDEVTAHGLFPAPSGKYRLAAVDWNVVAPGGHCLWQAFISQQSGARHFSAGRGILKPGRHTMTFVMDGAVAAAAPTGEWTIEPKMSCGAVELDAGRRPPRLSLPPTQFEPSQRDLPLEMGTHNSAWLEPGGEWATAIWFDGKRLDEVTVAAGTIAPGLEAFVSPIGRRRDRARFEIRVAASRNAKPGRYLLPLEVAAGARKSLIGILVHVVR